MARISLPIFQAKVIWDSWWCQDTNHPEKAARWAQWSKLKQPSEYMMDSQYIQLNIMVLWINYEYNDTVAH